MPVIYRVLLEVPDGAQEAVTAGALSLEEAYSGGWSGSVHIGMWTVEPVSIGTMAAIPLMFDLVPGRPVTVSLTMSVDPEDPEYGHMNGRVVRRWPSMVTSVAPDPSPQSNHLARSELRIVDPITYLADRPIWGAYRVCSIAEMVGGALSLAAGGDGKPSLHPLLPQLPQVTIAEDYRDKVIQLPYAIAAGETLGVWLDRVLATLGIRVEMLCREDGGIQVTLSDREPGGAPMDVAVLGDSTTSPGDDDSGETNEDDPSDDTPVAPSPLLVRNLSVYRGGRRRGAVLDDPVHGGFRVIGEGVIGSVSAGPDIGLDEANRRERFQLERASAEMVLADVKTAQPGFRPGRLVRTDRPLIGDTSEWQLSGVLHKVNGGVYVNYAELMDAGVCWRPPVPLRRSAVYVAGVIDGGTEMQYGEPVSRDRLGRIPVRFPFVPSPMGEEAKMLELADSNADGRITLADFDAESVADYTDNETQWEEEVRRYEAGEYDELGELPEDPDPDEEGQELDVLNEERARKREEIVRYLAYRQASEAAAADTDKDGYVTDLDSFVEDPVLQAYTSGAPPSDEEETAKWEAYVAGRERARTDADTASEQWPPRLPLTIIQPMAGALHGFIASHRQGDSCRIAVHEPFWAEIVGFQYRENLKINASLTEATAGVVVEHNTGDAWSGMVFRPTDALSDGTE